MESIISFVFIGLMSIAVMIIGYKAKQSTIANMLGGGFILIVCIVNRDWLDDTTLQMLILGCIFIMFFGYVIDSQREVK